MNNDGPSMEPCGMCDRYICLQLQGSRFKFKIDASVSKPRRPQPEQLWLLLCMHFSVRKTVAFHWTHQKKTFNVPSHDILLVQCLFVSCVTTVCQLQRSFTND